MDFTKSCEILQNFPSLLLQARKIPQKHLSRQKYMLMLSYNLKCVFPFGETHLKALIMLKLRCISLKQLHLISVVDNSFFQNLNLCCLPSFPYLSFRIHCWLLLAFFDGDKYVYFL